MVRVPPANVLTLTNRTIRQIALVSLGGRRLRVRLSNAWGEHPLNVGSAHVALQDTGATIVMKSSRRLTFGGRPAVVIRPGAVVLSDPLEFNMPQRGSLAVSLYFPDSVFISTLAIAGGQLSYTSAPGDFSGADRMPVESVRAGWMFLTGVDVVNDSADGTIAVFGSSIAGGGNSARAGDRFSDVLAERLLTARQGPMLGVVAATINGNRVLGGGRGRPLLGRFDDDVASQPGITHVIVMEGLNDAAFAHSEPGPPVTAADIILGLTQLAERAHERGLIVFAGTQTPTEGTTYGAPARRSGSAEEEIRSAVNEWIRNNRVFDGFIDFDACVRDPQRPVRLLAKYDSGDHLHLNDEGNRALGECVDRELFLNRKRG